MSNDRLLLVANNGAMVAEGNATDDFIKSRIFTIRGVQVMLDRDLAVLYGIETRALNQAVKRNADRFPPDLMFQVETAEVINALEPSEPQATPSRSQFVTLNKGRGQNIKYRPNTIFKAMDGGDFPPQRVFFDGKHYDAFSFARKLVRKAAKSIVLVDNYCDDTTLDILSQKHGGADVTVATLQKCVTQFLTPAAVAKFNKQNPTLTVKAVAAFHDRFLVLDGTELYHLGASLKDLGRKYCAVTKMDSMFIPSIMQRI